MVRTQQLQFKIRPDFWAQYQCIKKYKRAKGIRMADWIEQQIYKEYRRMEREQGDKV